MDVVTPVLGLIDAVTSGVRLLSDTESESVSVPPSSSDAVAVQLISSSGDDVDEVKVNEVPTPRMVPSLSLRQA